MTGALARLRSQGANVMFEGAQGAMLDVDVGHLSVRHLVQYHRRRGRHRHRRRAVRMFDHVLGIVKAYTTRVGAGPFPTELFDEYGEHLSRVGHEFGSVTGRRRRCGWFDAMALRRSIVHSSVSGLCMTKLDVLDGLETIRLCVGYRVGGETLPEPPLFADAYAEIEPVYEEMPGWKDSTVGVREHGALPLQRAPLSGAHRGAGRRAAGSDLHRRRIGTRPSCCAIRSTPSIWPQRLSYFPAACPPEAVGVRLRFLAHRPHAVRAKEILARRTVLKEQTDGCPCCHCR